jgi:hypothetical protein
MTPVALAASQLEHSSATDHQHAFSMLIITSEHQERLGAVIDHLEERIHLLPDSRDRIKSLVLVQLPHSHISKAHHPQYPVGYRICRRMSNRNLVCPTSELKP